MEDLWLKTSAFGSYLGNGRPQKSRFYPLNHAETEVIWLNFRKPNEFLYTHRSSPRTQ
jgi:hypothetical protein